ncbi:hypothetical protein SAMN06265361_11011 [Laceyella tengchongensis]|uniref:Uncharacterized protein n=1 Tax=Laceyella tengchongensis TaxID=574699 RepID=A0AA45WRV8_9BACL|nr:hypothetical protein SAMN06265361_11011 [Laceyella tengchongensis]
MLAYAVVLQDRTFIRVCLANQVSGEEAADKTFSRGGLATREANEKMFLESLAYLSDTP